MKRFFKVFCLSLAFVLVACSSPATKVEYIVEANEAITLLNSHLDKVKDDKEFEEKITALSDAFAKIDALEMSEENEKITAEVVKNGNDLVECVKNLRTYHLKDNVDKYNAEIINYNKLISTMNDLSDSIVE